MKRETMVGLAWALGLVLAMVVVFLYGLTVYEPARFAVTWTDTEHMEAVRGEPLQAGTDRTHVFLVPGANLTAVVVLLEWTDPIGPENDRFMLTVRAPDHPDEEVSGVRSPLELAFPLAERPGMASVEGADASHALTRLVRAPDPWNGDAQWEVIVRLDDAPGRAGTAGLDFDAQPDGENDYTLRLVRVTTDATIVPII